MNIAGVAIVAWKRSSTDLVSDSVFTIRVTRDHRLSMRYGINVLVLSGLMRA
jgi:hypothetical protein